VSCEPNRTATYCSAAVRELQADPIIGVNGQRLISADTPTNIFFFIASWRPVQE